MCNRMASIQLQISRKPLSISYQFSPVHAIVLKSSGKSSRKKKKKHRMKLNLARCIFMTISVRTRQLGKKTCCNRMHFSSKQLQGREQLSQGRSATVVLTSRTGTDGSLCELLQPHQCTLVRSGPDSERLSHFFINFSRDEKKKQQRQQHPVGCRLQCTTMRQREIE